MRDRIVWMCVCVAALAARCSWAGEVAKPVVPPSPFAVVMIDQATEKELGVFPYDRAVTAKGIEALAELKARGVVLKFFIDRPKSAKGDAALAAAMKRIKVIMQARIDDDEAKPNPLPERFVLKGLGKSDVKPITGQSGWLPLAELSKDAYDLGFIDPPPSIEQVALVERYRGKDVKSLYTAALEMACGEQAKIALGKSIELKGKKIAMDEHCFASIKLAAADTLETMSFIDLIHHKIPAERLADRVVILGYDGAKMERNKTSIGEVKGHRIFCYQLFSLFNELRPD